MKVAVINYSGSVRKTLISSYLLAPRLTGAKFYAVETINQSASDLGIENVTQAVSLILRRAGAVRRLASSAFSSRLERTRHRSISSTGRLSGRSSCTENGICSRFASAQ